MPIKKDVAIAKTAMTVYAIFFFIDLISFLAVLILGIKIAPFALGATVFGLKQFLLL